MALRTLQVFISSPGDVAEERLITRRVMGRINSQVGEMLLLKPVFWEHQPLLATASFQEQLPKPSETDIVITILWSRLGTVLPEHIRRADGTVYASGTEFEFEDAMNAHRSSGKPDVLVYRKSAAPSWSADPAAAAEQMAQSQSLNRFIAKWFTNDADGSLKAAFHTFESPADFEEMVEAHLLQLIEPYLLPGFRSRVSAPTWRSGSPFRGLEPFEVEHAPVFFGRTAAVAAVLERIRRQMEHGRAFVLIVSSSGCGKSSLVRAGVLPLLLQPGVVGNASQWRHAILRPSDGQGDLLRALSRALQQPLALPGASVVDGAKLTADVIAALDRIAPVRPDGSDGGCHLALVVDQFEEIFSDERISDADRRRFVALLAALAGSGRVCVLATLRSDAYPRLAELPALMDLKQGDGHFDLLPPATREIGQIIRFPATAAGLRFEVREHTGERLDDVIRDAAAKNAAALPLLEFLLEELYKHRSSEDVLTFRAFEDLGRVEGALAQRAEQVVAEVSSDAQSALPTVFGELVTLGIDDENKVLRRTAPRSAFVTAGANEMVDALLGARLLISGSDAQGAAVVSLAHEALLEFWPRLSDWRERNRENLQIHARVSAAVSTWEKEGRSPDFLLARGKPIAEARGLIADGVRLSGPESDLVNASIRRAQRFARLRAGAIASLAVLTIIASAAAYLANRQSGLARTQATTAQRTTDFMVNLFAIADPEENRGESVTVREILDRGVTEMEHGLSGEDAVRANLLRAMGQAYNGLGLYPKAQELLREAAGAAKKSGVPRDILAADLALGANRGVDGDYKEAELLYRKALTEARQLHGDLDPAVTEAMTGLADNLYALERPLEAEPLYRQALAVDIKLHGENHADTARSLNAMGWFLYFEGRYAEAEPVWQRALAVRRNVFGERHAKTAESLNNLGSLFYQEGKFDLAYEAWMSTLKIEKIVFGENHPVVSPVLNNLGRVALLRDDLVSADAHMNAALALDRKWRPAGHDDFVSDLNSLAMIHLERGEYGPAEDNLREALEIARQHHHFMLDQVLANTGDLYVRTGRLQDADDLLAQSKSALEAQYGDALQTTDSWRRAVFNSILASLEYERGNFPAAEKLLLSGRPAILHRFGERSLYARQSAYRLHRLYSKWGRETQARRYAESAAPVKQP